MAEINIERKKKSVWPWVFLLLLVALLAWAIYELANDEDEVQNQAAPATGMVLPTQPQTIPAFVHLSVVKNLS